MMTKLNRPARKRVVPTPADYKTPVARLFEKPYSEWTKRERKWLDETHKRLFPSRRGRKRKKKYDDLFREREIAMVRAKYPGIFGASVNADSGKAPSYTQLASQSEGAPVSGKPEDEDPARQRFIRAYQRRKKALHLPEPPKS